MPRWNANDGGGAHWLDSGVDNKYFRMQFRVNRSASLDFYIDTDCSNPIYLCSLHDIDISIPENEQKYRYLTI